MNRSLYLLCFLLVVIPENLVSADDCGPCKTSYDAETLSAVPSYVKGTLTNCAATKGKKAKEFVTCKEDHGSDFGYSGTDALKCCNSCSNAKNKGMETLCQEAKQSGDKPVTNCVVEQIRYVTEKANRFSAIKKVVDYSADLMKSCCTKNYNDGTCNDPK